MRALTAMPLMLVPMIAFAGAAHAQSATNCSVPGPPAALAVQPTVLPAVAPEFVAPRHQLGAPTGVLAQAFDEAQSVDNVLLRLRLESCRSVANALPAATPANGIIDPATYKPKTQFDNTPWRFDMNQNGKRMTAEEFDQWMKARGVRVAKGAGVGTTSAAPPATPAAPADAAPASAPATPPTKPDGSQ